MAGRGRPKVHISQEEFEKLCELQCTLGEMESYLRVSEDTIENWCKKTYKMNFSEVFRLKRGNGKVSLRRSQFRLAETNPTMAIWLGKQYLGQTDKQEVTISRQTDETIKEMEEYFDNQRRSSESPVDEAD